MLYRISAGGITVFLSDLIVDPEREEEAYLVSVAGHQAAVKGILANFLEYQTLTATVGRKTYQVSRASGSYVMKVRKMPSGSCYGTALPRIALAKNDGENGEKEFLILAGDVEDAKLRFFAILDGKTEIPLHPGWKDWLWNLFHERQWLTEMKTLAGRYAAYHASLKGDELLAQITKAIQTGVPEVVSCMKPGQAKGGE